MGDLGESESPMQSLDLPPVSRSETIVEFHKLIDASGGTESVAERARMFKICSRARNSSRRTSCNRTLPIETARVENRSHPPRQTFTALITWLTTAREAS